MEAGVRIKKIVDQQIAYHELQDWKLKAITINWEHILYIDPRPEKIYAVYDGAHPGQEPSND